MHHSVTCQNAEHCLHVVMDFIPKSLGEFVPTSLNTSVAASLQLALQHGFMEASDRFISSYVPPALEPHLHSLPAKAAPSTLDSHLCRRASQWAHNLVEALTRLTQDWQQLIELRYIGSNVQLTHVSQPLGDPHNCGRSVIKLTFSDERALIYKPRPVDSELLFGGLLSTLRAEGCHPVMSTCRVLPRGHYGWADFIESTPADNEEEISRFYRRQGGFLALFWLFGATDAIADNVVVHGSDPFWIDTECMCVPQLPHSIDEETRKMPLWIRESVLPTAMVVDGAAGGRTVRKRSTGLSVSCAVDRSRVFRGAVLKQLYANDVVEGFRGVYTWFLSHRDSIGPSGALLLPWLKERLRFIPRPTYCYSALLSWSLLSRPVLSQDEVDATLKQVLSSNGPGSAPLVELEVEALRRADIPYFFSSPMSKDLWDPQGNHLERVARASGFECIQRRAVRMSSEDRELQAWLISSYLAGHGAGT